MFLPPTSLLSIHLPKRWLFFHLKLKAPAMPRAALLLLQPVPTPLGTPPSPGLLPCRPNISSSPRSGVWKKTNRLQTWETASSGN